eukprot:9475017-Pyramimonas_sp.AAC.3
MHRGDTVAGLEMAVSGARGKYATLVSYYFILRVLRYRVFSSTGVANEGTPPVHAARVAHLKGFCSGPPERERPPPGERVGGQAEARLLELTDGLPQRAKPGARGHEVVVPGVGDVLEGRCEGTRRSSLDTRKPQNPTKKVKNTRGIFR